MSKISNGQVVFQLRSGDRRGCELLLSLYQRRLIRECIHGFCVDAMDAEEIVNDALMAVVQKIGSFSFKRSESDFHYWVMAIFRNKVRDFLRRRAAAGGCVAERMTSVDIYEMRDGIKVPFHEAEYCDNPRKSSLTAGVADLLSEIPVWERVLLLCRADQIPYHEIARFTGKTVDQLKVYYPRVRRKFRRLLVQRYPDLERRFGSEETKKQSSPSSGVRR